MHTHIYIFIDQQIDCTSSPLQVLQKLGKADETRDVAFEEMVANFNKQMVRLLLHYFTSLFVNHDLILETPIYLQASEYISAFDFATVIS